MSCKCIYFHSDIGVTAECCHCICRYHWSTLGQYLDLKNPFNHMWSLKICTAALFIVRKSHFETAGATQCLQFAGFLLHEEGQWAVWYHLSVSGSLPFIAGPWGDFVCNGRLLVCQSTDIFKFGRTIVICIFYWDVFLQRYKGSCSHFQLRNQKWNISSSSTLLGVAADGHGKELYLLWVPNE